MSSELTESPTLKRGALTLDGSPAKELIGGFMGC
jgi:hypothetical protein